MAGGINSNYSNLYRNYFNKLDKNQDGEVSNLELLQQGADEKLTAENFKDSGEYEDGKLTYEEFLAWANKNDFYKRIGSGTASSTTTGQSTTGSTTAGQSTTGSTTAGQSTTGSTTAGQATTDELMTFERADSQKNQDGKVTKLEFLKIWYEEKDNIDENLSALEQFALADKDKDNYGYLTEDEFNAWYEDFKTYNHTSETSGLSDDINEKISEKIDALIDRLLAGITGDNKDEIADTLGEHIQKFANEYIEQYIEQYSTDIDDGEVDYFLYDLEKYVVNQLYQPKDDSIDKSNEIESIKSGVEDLNKDTEGLNGTIESYITDMIKAGYKLEYFGDTVELDEVASIVSAYENDGAALIELVKGYVANAVEQREDAMTTLIGTIFSDFKLESIPKKPVTDLPFGFGDAVNTEIADLINKVVNNLTSGINNANLSAELKDYITDEIVIKYIKENTDPENLKYATEDCVNRFLYDLEQEIVNKLYSDNGIDSKGKEIGKIEIDFNTMVGEFGYFIDSISEYPQLRDKVTEYIKQMIDLGYTVKLGDSKIESTLDAASVVYGSYPYEKRKDLIEDMNKLIEDCKLQSSTYIEQIFRGYGDNVHAPSKPDVGLTNEALEQTFNYLLDNGSLKYTRQENDNAENLLDNIKAFVKSKLTDDLKVTSDILGNENVKFDDTIALIITNVYEQSLYELSEGEESVELDDLVNKFNENLKSAVSDFNESKTDIDVEDIDYSSIIPEAYKASWADKDVTVSMTRDDVSNLLSQLKGVFADKTELYDETVFNTVLDIYLPIKGLFKNAGDVTKELNVREVVEEFVNKYANSLNAVIADSTKNVVDAFKDEMGAAAYWSGKLDEYLPSLYATVETRGSFLDNTLVPDYVTDLEFTENIFGSGYALKLANGYRTLNDVSSINNENDFNKYTNDLIDYVIYKIDREILTKVNDNFYNLSRDEFLSILGRLGIEESRQCSKEVMAIYDIAESRAEADLGSEADDSLAAYLKDAIAAYLNTDNDSLNIALNTVLKKSLPIQEEKIEDAVIDECVDAYKTLLSEEQIDEIKDKLSTQIKQFITTYESDNSDDINNMNSEEQLSALLSNLKPYIQNALNEKTENGQSVLEGILKDYIEDLSVTDITWNSVSEIIDEAKSEYLSGKLGERTEGNAAEYDALAGLIDGYINSYKDGATEYEIKIIDEKNEIDVFKDKLTNYVEGQIKADANTNWNAILGDDDTSFVNTYVNNLLIENEEDKVYEDQLQELVNGFVSKYREEVAKDYELALLNTNDEDAVTSFKNTLKTYIDEQIVIKASNNLQEILGSGDTSFVNTYVNNLEVVEDGIKSQLQELVGNIVNDYKTNTPTYKIALINSDTLNNYVSNQITTKAEENWQVVLGDEENGFVSQQVKRCLDETAFADNQTVKDGLKDLIQSYVDAYVIEDYKLALLDTDVEQAEFSTYLQNDVIEPALYGQDHSKPSDWHTLVYTNAPGVALNGVMKDYAIPEDDNDKTYTLDDIENADANGEFDNFQIDLIKHFVKQIGFNIFDSENEEMYKIGEDIERIMYNSLNSAVKDVYAQDYNQEALSKNEIIVAYNKYFKSEMEVYCAYLNNDTAEKMDIDQVATLLINLGIPAGINPETINNDNPVKLDDDTFANMAYAYLANVDSDSKLQDIANEFRDKISSYVNGTDSVNVVDFIKTLDLGNDVNKIKALSLSNADYTPKIEDLGWENDVQESDKLEDLYNSVCKNVYEKFQDSFKTLWDNTITKLGIQNKEALDHVYTNACRDFASGVVAIAYEFKEDTQKYQIDMNDIYTILADTNYNFNDYINLCLYEYAESETDFDIVDIDYSANESMPEKGYWYKYNSNIDYDIADSILGNIKEQLLQKTEAYITANNIIDNASVAGDVVDSLYLWAASNYQSMFENKQKPEDYTATTSDYVNIFVEAFKEVVEIIFTNKPEESGLNSYEDIFNTEFSTVLKEDFGPDEG